MNDLKTITRNAAAGLLTALVATGAAYALWLGAPLLNSTVGDVFATDIPVVRLSHPPVSSPSTPIDYAAVVAASRNLVMNPKPVPPLPPVAMAAPPSPVRTAAPVAKPPFAHAPVAVKTRTATALVVQKVAASKSDASTAVQPKHREGSSGEHATSADGHRSAGTAHSGESSQSEER